jgi:hypothetical protein
MPQTHFHKASLKAGFVASVSGFSKALDNTWKVHTVTPNKLFYIFFVLIFFHDIQSLS